MVKSSSDNYRESSAKCLVIGFCLYIDITFHNNLTEAKIANELATSVQLINVKLSRVLLPGLILQGCYKSCATSGFGQSREMKYFCHRC